MDIRPDPPPIETGPRRRATGRGEDARATGAEAAPPSGGNRHDSAEVQLDAAEAQRYVDRLRNYNPTDLHRLDELKAAVADGSYQADPTEFADRLLAALDRGFLD